MLESASGVKLAGLAHHLIDLGDVLLLEGDLLPGIFFKPHALVDDEPEQNGFPVVEQRQLDPERTVGRNDPCPCGSGKKYKKCHGTAA